METRSNESDLPALSELGDWELQIDDQDIRGLPLVDARGEPLGRIDDLLIDRDEERVAAVRLISGRTFPVEPLEIEDSRVVLREERREETVAPAPAPVRDRPVRQEPEVQAMAEPKLQREPIRVRRKAVEQRPPVSPRPATGRRPNRSYSQKSWEQDLDWNKIGLGAAVVGALAGAAMLRRRGKDEDYELRLETDENVRLIASDKVEGTPVYARDGKQLGEIDSFMVDKYTGRVAYAVMKLSGKFGFGSSLFPLPWRVLKYDVNYDGYRLAVTKDQFADAPRFEPSDEPEFDDDYRRRVTLFYRGTA